MEEECMIRIKILFFYSKTLPFLSCDGSVWRKEKKCCYTAFVIAAGTAIIALSTSKSACTTGTITGIIIEVLTFLPLFSSLVCDMHLKYFILPASRQKWALPYRHKQALAFFKAWPAWSRQGTDITSKPVLFTAYGLNRAQLSQHILFWMQLFLVVLEKLLCRATKEELRG